MSAEKRDFDKMAQTWDENPDRIALAKTISQAMLEHVAFTPEMDILDYGCGTGLVTLEIQPHVRSIIAMDSSEGMLSILQQKLDAHGIKNVTTMHIDLVTDDFPPLTFHAIISSMTLHHVEHPPQFLSKLAGMLEPGGILCISDLDEEDGSFHTDKTGVFHYGFGHEERVRLFREAGLVDVSDSTAVTFSRETQGGEAREFSVFLTTGRRP